MCDAAPWQSLVTMVTIGHRPVLHLAGADPSIQSPSRRRNQRVGIVQNRPFESKNPPTAFISHRERSVRQSDPAKRVNSSQLGHKSTPTPLTFSCRFNGKRRSVQRHPIQG
jgi:hypothetical protein